MMAFVLHCQYCPTAHVGINVSDGTEKCLICLGINERDRMEKCLIFVRATHSHMLLYINDTFAT